MASSTRTICRSGTSRRRLDSVSKNDDDGRTATLSPARSVIPAKPGSSARQTRISRTKSTGTENANRRRRSDVAVRRPTRTSPRPSSRYSDRILRSPTLTTMLRRSSHAASRRAMRSSFSANRPAPAPFPSRGGGTRIRRAPRSRRAARSPVSTYPESATASIRMGLPDGVQPGRARNPSSTIVPGNVRRRRSRGDSAGRPGSLPSMRTAYPGLRAARHSLASETEPERGGSERGEPTGILGSR